MDIFRGRFSVRTSHLFQFGIDVPNQAGHAGPMLIYKILRAPEWEKFQENGRFDGAEIDLSDGYIHTSTAAQALETAARHFAGAEGLWLLALESESFGAALKWEPSRGGDLFPHIYRAVTLDEIVWAKPLPLGPQGHLFPELAS